MKKLLLATILFSLCIINNLAQQQIKIMSYNLLNYDGTDTTTRNPYFRTVISSVNPDILVVVEMTTPTQVNNFRTKVLNTFGETYNAGTYLYNPVTVINNALYYKPSKISFISNTAIKTELRDINEYRVKSVATGDTLIIYALHLKSGSEPSSALQRSREVDSLRKFTNNLPSGNNYIVLGDFNIYESAETAFQKLLNQSLSGYFIDPKNLVGKWNNNSSFAPHHTQSTRTRSFGNGATGGLDDRFDMILMSQAVMNSGGITFIAGSYTPYGNDGSHYNDSINHPPNNAVGQPIANALHYASDHLPVFASFNFAPRDTTITLQLTALIEGLYNGASMVSDTVKVYLRQAVSPYAKVDSLKILLNSSGYGTGTFNKTASGTYYITITHRNSIETWSKAGGESLSQGSSISYDFTTASSKAYGSNLILKGSKWCIYSGDINQDGFINSSDLILIENDALSYSAGYRTADITGDNFIDLNDLILCDNNTFNSVRVLRPITESD